MANSGAMEAVEAMEAMEAVSENAQLSNLGERALAVGCNS